VIVEARRGPLGEEAEEGLADPDHLAAHERAGCDPRRVHVEAVRALAIRDLEAARDPLDRRVPPRGPLVL
jgi:hypothetical protein